MIDNTCYLTRMYEKYRPLTTEEIKALPLDLRVCYFLHPWNVRAEIKSVKDWVDIFFCWHATHGDYSDEQLKGILQNDLERLLNFINELQEEGRFK